MCGIFGITGRGNLAPVLVEGLERLEYRGYDSCGVVMLDGSGRLAFAKGAGEVSVVRKEERFDELSGSSGIGHTRWATHGRVSRVNAHPHFDESGEIAVVHNGIIENHEELRASLEKDGCTFLSETDTEVIAHLIERKAKSAKNFEEAILAAVRELKGTFGLGIMTSRTPGTLYGLRKESPLIAGLGEDFCCFASDPLAFNSLTNRVVYLRDGEMVAIDPKGIHLREIATGKEIQRTHEILKLEGGRADKGDFPDFMSKEISENGLVARSALSIPEAAIDGLVETLRANKRTFLTGMGTAYYVALMGQYFLARYGGRYFPALSADELPHLVRFGAGDHVLAISQSGETYDTLRALRGAKTRGATTSAILNVPTSSMAREMDRFVAQSAGPEICVLSTKSTISQLVVMARVALRLGEREGIGNAAENQRLRDELKRLPGLLDQVQHQSHDHLRDLARQFSVIRNWFFIGRGIYSGLAMEAALKFKEVTYSHAEGMPAGFLKHGTISLIDESMHTAVFLPGDDEEELRTMTLGAASEINARGGSIVAFQPDHSSTTAGIFAAVVSFPRCGPLGNPFLALMQAQLFAYYTARALGRNVDKPRALAKSVTVG